MFIEWKIIIAVEGVTLKNQYRILFLSHASFATGFVVGSHHLSNELQKQGHEVFHVSSPVTPLHIFRGSIPRKKLKASFISFNKNGWGVIDYIPLVPFPYGRADFLDKINNLFILLYFKIKKNP